MKLEEISRKNTKIININNKSVKKVGKIKYQIVLNTNQMKKSYCLLKTILKQTYNIEIKEVYKATKKLFVY